MGLYNFQLRFAPAIKAGIKTSTIRSIRKHPQKVGKLMYLYTGLRQSGAAKIIEPQICTDVKTIIIYPDGKVLLLNKVLDNLEAGVVAVAMENQSVPAQKMTDAIYEALVGHKELSTTEKDELAYHDGFWHEEKPEEQTGCFEIMLRWWKQTHQLPFVGHVNYWK